MFCHHRTSIAGETKRPSSAFAISQIFVNKERSMKIKKPKQLDSRSMDQQMKVDAEHQLTSEVSKQLLRC